MLAPDTKIEIISNAKDFALLEKDWETVYQRFEHKSIFNTYTWNKTWWDTYSDPNCDLSVLVFRQNGQVTGIAPFYIKTTRHLLITIRELRFIGTGEEEAEEVSSEYLDILTDKEHAGEVSRQLCNYLISDKANWDTLVFDRLLAYSYIKTHVMSYLQEQDRYLTVQRKLGYRYMIKFTGDFEDYIKTLGKSFRETSRRVMRKIEKNHQPEMEDINCHEDIEQAIDDLAHLHKMRWNDRELQGTFMEPRFISFHKKLSKQLLHQGKLVLQFMRINNSRAAGFYGYSNDGVTAFYQSGFDTMNYPNDSLGTVSLLYAIRSAVQNNSIAFDFMLGEMDSYKNRYGCDKTDMYQVKVYRWKKTAWLANSIRQFAKKLLQHNTRKK